MWVERGQHTVFLFNIWNSGYMIKWEKFSISIEYNWQVIKVMISYPKLGGSNISKEKKREKKDTCIIFIKHNDFRRL